MNIQRILIALSLGILSTNVFAQSAQQVEAPKYVAPAPIVTVESMLQMVGGLLLVLCIIGGIAWLLKRFSIFPQATAGAIKITASANVGQRERIVIVEVEDARLVLGVTSQQINTLHRLPKVPSSKSESATDDSLIHDKSFSEKLNQTLGKKDDR